MVEYIDRLQWAMTRANRSRKDLAARLGMSYQGVRKAANGESKSLTARNNELAAAYLGVSARWLATGYGRPDEAGVTGNTSRTVTVPLLNWQQITTTGVHLRKLDEPPGGGEWIATTGEQERPAAFALAVIGDAMVGHNPNDESLPAGTIIVIDPAEKPQSGDYVLATDPVSQEPSFRRLMQDSGRWFLRPLNSSYPTTEISDPSLSVLGRVFEYQLRRSL